jgi:hypothetical protein
LTGSSIAEVLAESFPPLRLYCPILQAISAQQAVFLLAEEEEVLYGGAVGGGKTAAMLMAAIQYVDVPGYAALLMRRTFPELEQPDNLIEQSLRWFGCAPRAVQPSYNQSDHEWTFPTGAKIRFGHLEGPNAILRYQGGAYHLIGFDEATHFEESEYDFIAFSRTRRPPAGPLSEVPIRIRASANPGGPGHNWVKKKFITERKPDVAFIPSKVYDNPGIDAADYVARLKKMNPLRVQQLLEGDWGAFEGQAFESFDRRIHCIEALRLPDALERFESMDYGSSNPTAWLSWAVDFDGNCIIHGSHYAPGLPSDTAPIILRLRQSWRSEWAVGDPASLAMPGSRKKSWDDPFTIRDEFAELGVHIEPANNEPRRGYTRLRELLKLDETRRFPSWHPLAGEMGAPRLFIVESECPELVEQLEQAPVQPADKRWGGEMIEPKWESTKGHAIAACRYGAMTRPSASPVPGPPEPETEEQLREAFLREHLNGERQLAFTD